jgi:hypothetical protein
MLRKHIQKKALVLIIIGTFFGMTTIPIAGDNAPDNTKLEILTMDPICDPWFFGVSRNSWFIECVTIGFSYDPEIVEEIQYSITLDPGEPEWENYNGDFKFCDDGEWTFQYKWKNKLTELWEFGEEQPLKIDQTAPTFSIEKRVHSIKKEITFKAKPNPDTSGIERVKFYLDNYRLKENLTEPPYEYTYTWEGKYPGYHWVTVVVYDRAGFSTEKTTLPVSHPYYSNIMSKIFYRLQTLFQLFIQFS